MKTPVGMVGLLSQLLSQFHAQMQMKTSEMEMTVMQLPWVLQVVDDLMTQGIQDVCVRFNRDLKAIVVTTATAETVKNALSNCEQYYCHNDTNEQVAVIEKDGEVVNGYTKLVVICTEFEVSHDH